jgi:hypothetical protein
MCIYYKVHCFALYSDGVTYLPLGPNAFINSFLSYNVCVPLFWAAKFITNKTQQVNSLQFHEPIL